jgi:hypothetical protein
MLRQDRADLFQEADGAILGARCASGVVIGESAAQPLQAASIGQDREHQRTRAHEPPTLADDPHVETSLGRRRRGLSVARVGVTTVLRIYSPAFAGDPSD